MERDPTRLIRLLPPSWAVDAPERGTLRLPGSALEIAFADPVLRIEGLRAPTIAAALSFFEVTEVDLDRIAAGHRFARVRSAEETARRIGNVASKEAENRLFLLFLAISMVSALLIIAITAVL